MSTSALPTLRQALRQLPHAVGTAGPQLQGSERTGHRWTSTWDLPSLVSTAGPQPGTFRAQSAPLDLNLGPSELSWTSTWDPPSSVSTAGPQRPDRMPEDMPDRTPDSMSERMPVSQDGCPVRAPFGGSSSTLADPDETDHASNAMDVESSEKRWIREPAPDH